MEKFGIGTDASIPVHINNICERNYVTVQSGRRVVPTELGITLVRGYQLIDPELCRPQVQKERTEQNTLIGIQWESWQYVDLTRSMVTYWAV